MGVPKFTQPPLEQNSDTLANAAVPNINAHPELRETPHAFNGLGMGVGMQGCVPGSVMLAELSPSVLKCFATGDMVGVQGLHRSDKI